jgi:glyoxylase-like metal-dependent hydrolase (beta-lactamase superfamily II)
MREVTSGVYWETKFAGVRVGAVAGGDDGLLLVDCPIRAEDGREWLAALADVGRPRFLAALDYHPDRVLGARALDLPLIAHDFTRQVIGGWPDTFKGNTAPIGAEADRLKRVTGVRKAIPELTFSDQMVIHLGDREVVLRHHPGPTSGSMWVEIPASRLAFIGDTVMLSEPPYLGEADPEAWLATLEAARKPPYDRYTLLPSKDARARGDEIAAMIRFLRKVVGRLERLESKGASAEAASASASSLLEGFRVPAARREQALLRLQTGLVRLFSRFYAPGK